MTTAYTSFQLVQRARYLRDVSTGKSVLHLGCTNWPYREQSAGDDRFIHFALTESAREVVGLDADQEGLDALAAKGVGNLVRGDLENLSAAPIDRTFDVIVAGEVIEHLSNPGQFLSGVKRFMTVDTRLVITTVNAYCGFRSVVYGLRGRGGRAEPVHPDHVAYYSFATLKHLCARHGLVQDEFMFYDLGVEHRPFVQRGVGVLNDAIVKLMPQLADGIIGVFRLQQDPAAT